MEDTFKALKEFFDSPEGKEWAEEYKQKQQNEKKHNNRWVKKFKNRYENNPDPIIETLLNKYNSSEYVRKEYSKGFEPRKELLWIVWSYAVKYCKRCKDKQYANIFTGEMYYIGSYVIQIMHGQGSVLRFDKIKQ